MKNIAKLVALTTLSTFAFADMTICFTKNLEDISRIEKVKLDGGLCDSVRNQKDMIRDGWKVDNVKITNNDYLFVFKKDVSNAEKNTVILKKETKESLKAEIIDELENKKQKEIEVAKKEVKLQEYEKGAKIYQNKCASCHGTNGEKKVAYSTPLNSISLDHFEDAISGYKIGSYDLGNASEMRPYAVGYTSSDIENIYKYIKKINK